MYFLLDGRDFFSITPIQRHTIFLSPPKKRKKPQKRSGTSNLGLFGWAWDWPNQRRGNFPSPGRRGGRILHLSTTVSSWRLAGIYALPVYVLWYVCIPYNPWLRFYVTNGRLFPGTSHTLAGIPRTVSSRLWENTHSTWKIGMKVTCLAIGPNLQYSRRD